MKKFQILFLTFAMMIVSCSCGESNVSADNTVSSSQSEIVDEQISNTKQSLFDNEVCEIRFGGIYEDNLDEIGSNDSEFSDKSAQSETKNTKEYPRNDFFISVSVDRKEDVTLCALIENVTLDGKPCYSTYSNENYAYFTILYSDADLEELRKDNPDTRGVANDANFYCKNLNFLRAKKIQFSVGVWQPSLQEGKLNLDDESEIFYKTYAVSLR